MENLQIFRTKFILIFLLFASYNSYSATLESILVDNDKDNKTISFNIDGNYQYRAFSLHNPERIVIDLDKTNLNPRLHNYKLANYLIKKIRYGHSTVNTLRIVLDLKQAVTFTSAKQNTRRTNESTLQIKLSPNYNKPALKQALNKNVDRPLRDVIVIIDPGHGGVDPGAIGIRKSREKNIVLAISQKLKTLIDKQKGMRAVLTRNGDYYVGLRERMEIARKHDGDIFVAIHADAFGNHDSHGASVFTLSSRGATSEAARWLAEKENYSELGGVDLSSLDDKNDEIRTVLIDLSQTATISSSLNMGGSVLQSLRKMTTLHSKKVEQARFVVLKSPDIPSVLIETGFISNPREERNLTSSKYQDKISLAIFQGIKTYFWNYPPYGSLIEAMAMRNRKIVRNNTSTKKI